MIPKLRFQEFEDSWSQVTIAEAASFRRGSFPQPYNIPQWYDDVNGMPFVQVVDVGNDFRLKPKTKQMISEMAMPKSVFVPKGSIVITIQGSIGRIALTQYDSYVDRTLLIITEKKLPLDDYFFIIALKKIFDYEKTIAVGGTIKTITKEKLAKFKFSLPHRSEQQRIGDFIRLVDQKINLLTKKKEALETYKKGLMQKLFSQELRFKREDGTDYPEWTRYILEELVEVQRGASPRPIQAYISTEGVNWIKIGDVKEGAKYITSTAQKITIEGSLKSRRVEPEDFILSNSMSFGRPYISKIHGYIHDGWLLLRNNNPEKLLNDFLYEILSSNSVKKQFVQLAAGSTVNNLKSDTVKKVSLHLPSIVEQSKIFETLNSISISIDLLQSRINKTKQLKKGLLQQMFA